MGSGSDARGSEGGEFWAEVTRVHPYLKPLTFYSGELHKLTFSKLGHITSSYTSLYFKSASTLCEKLEKLGYHVKWQVERTGETFYETEEDFSE